MAMKHYKLRFFKFRLFVILILVVLLVVQLRTIPEMIMANEPPKFVNDSYFDTIQPGEEISGKVTHIVGHFDADYTDIDQQINNYVVLTPANKVILFRAMENTKTDKEMQKLMKGEVDSVSYRGRAAVIHPTRKPVLQVYLLSNLGNGDLAGIKISDVDVRNIEIDMIEPESKIPEKYIIFTVVGAVLLLILLVWLLIKPINNFIYNVLVYKGKIKPELKITKADLTVDCEGEYKDGASDGYFYVNTDYDENKDRQNPEDKAEKTEEDGTSENAEGEEYIPTGPMRAYDEDFFYTKGADDDGNFFVNSEDDHSDYHAKDKYHY